MEPASGKQTSKAKPGRKRIACQACSASESLLPHGISEPLRVEAWTGRSRPPAYVFVDAACD